MPHQIQKKCAGTYEAATPEKVKLAGTYIYATPKNFLEMCGNIHRCHIRKTKRAGTCVDATPETSFKVREHT